MKTFLIFAVAHSTLINPFFSVPERLGCFTKTSANGTLVGVTLFQSKQGDQVNVGICTKNGCSFGSVFDSKLVENVGWIDDDTVGVSLKNSPVYLSMNNVKINGVESRILTKVHIGKTPFIENQSFDSRECKKGSPIVVTAQ